MSDAWNLQRLRFGDRLSCGVANVHPQQFPIASVLRSAWGQIHAKAVAYEGLDGTRRQLEIASVVAAAMSTLQTRFVDSTVEQICRSKACAIIFKYYDATPRDISFGELRGQMAPHARYPVLQEDGKWKCLSLDELRQVKGSRLAVHHGVVDLLASSMECYWTDNVDKAQADTWTMHGLRVLVPPVFLQRGNASCLYEATEKSVPAFSSEGIRQLCAHCPFVIRCEVPDFCGSNGRKVCQSIADTADILNEFTVQARCGAHQVFRIVSQVEKKVVGDVHAIIVAATQVHHQQRLWNAFREILAEVQVFWGVDPLAANMRVNRDIARHTLLRDEEYVIGDSVLDSEWLGRQDPDNSCERFLTMFNGHWGAARVQHYCNGCCPYLDVDAVVDNLYAAAFGVDLLCTREKEPCIDDWQTSGRACGKATAGIQCHELLPRSFVRAMPSWSSMLPPSNDRSDGCTAARNRIQNKTFRALKTLTEPAQRRKVLTMTYVAWPLERMQRELGFLDSAGNGLYDVCSFNDDLNVFAKCRRTIMKHMRDGKNGELGSLFQGLAEDQHDSLREDIRAMSLAFASQVAWRFKEYRCFPRKLSKAYHPGGDDNLKAETFREFFSRRKCCRRPESCEKIFQYFGGSAEAMKENKAFGQTIKAFTKKYRFTGMAMERLLAAFRRNTRERGVHAERVTAVGLLSQCLDVHGGLNPAYLSRAKLLVDGVPIKCHQDAKADTKRVGTFFTWKAEQEAIRKHEGKQLLGDAYRMWLREKSAEWQQLNLERRTEALHKACAEIQYIILYMQISYYICNIRVEISCRNSEFIY